MKSVTLRKPNVAWTSTGPVFPGNVEECQPDAGKFLQPFFLSSEDNQT